MHDPRKSAAWSDNVGGIAFTLLILLLTAAMSRCIDAPRKAHAQDTEPNEQTVQVLLQAFVAEADFDAPADHAAIGHVLLRRAADQGLTVDELTARYVSVFRVAVASKPRTQWVRGLTTTCEAPPSWPRSEHWSRTACLNVVARARALLAGELADPCHGHAQHWGAPTGIDHERAMRARWTRVDCGATRNAFWR